MLILKAEEFRSTPQPCFCPLKSPADLKDQDAYYVGMNAHSLRKQINSYEEIILIFC